MTGAGHVRATFVGCAQALPACASTSGIIDVVSTEVPADASAARRFYCAWPVRGDNP